MYKQILFIFSFLLIAPNLSAQYRKLTQKELEENGRKNHNALYGDIYTLCFFIDTAKDEWSEEEVEHYLFELESSQYWLAEEASVYGVELNFINDFFETVEEVIEVPYVNRWNSWKLMEEVMLQMSYKDYKEFLDWQQFDLTNNKLSVLFFVKSNNRSHARNYKSKDKLDTAVIYANSTYGMRTSQYTISHELLHLFGAWDLYQGESQTESQAQKLKELFPNSIMINTWRNQENLEVDELTSFLVGWQLEIEKEYLAFRPDRVAARKEMQAKKRKTLKFSLSKEKEGKN